jgi:hypothetical protein
VAERCAARLPSSEACPIAPSDEPETVPLIMRLMTPLAGRLA